MSHDCNSKYCRNYSEYEFCRCKLASRSGSAATVQECIAFRKLKEDEKLLKDLLESNEKL